MKYRSLVLVGAALQAGLAHGIGLGGIQVQSTLGSPLKANITLPSSELFSESDFKIGLADIGVYEQLGARYQASHGNIQFNIGKDISGGWQVRIESNQSIVEPFLDIVVQLSWAEGSVYRRYNLLLDPPGYGNMIAAKAQKFPNIAPIEVNSGLADSLATEFAPRMEKYPAYSYQVKSGDSLWSISKRLKLESHSLSEKMDIVYKSNIDAFIDGDRNRLKAGASLVLPDRSVVSRVDETIEKQSPLVSSKASSERSESKVNIQRSEYNQLNQRLLELKRERQKVISDRQILEQKLAALKAHLNKEISQTVPLTSSKVDIVPMIMTPHQSKFNVFSLGKEHQTDISVDLLMSNYIREWWIGAGLIPFGILLYGLRRRMRSEVCIETVSDEELYEIVFGSKRNRNIPESPNQIKTAIGMIKEKAICYELLKEREKQEVNVTVGDIKQMVELYMDHGQYEHSLALLMPEIEKNPLRKDLRLMLIEIYFQMQDWDRFNEQLKMAVKTGDHLFIEQIKSMKIMESTFDFDAIYKNIA